MTMTLEDFETHYIPRGSRPHYGRAAKFLLDLEPLTPTVAAFPSPSLKSRRNSLQGQWTGTGANVAVQPVNKCTTDDGHVFKEARDGDSA